MAGLNLSQARAVDPILTAVAQGYKHAERVGHTLFPAVPVEVRGGTVLEFGRESFRLYMSRRAPGAPVLSIDFGYKGTKFELTQDALKAKIPREILDDARAVPNVNMQTRAVNVCMSSLTLTVEAEQAKLATDPANFADDRKLALAGEAKWSAPDSDPAEDVAGAKEAIRMSCGVDPNRMVISSPIFRALKNHPKIVERFKYTTADSITAAMLANYFDLDMLKVGKAVALDGAAATDAPFADVWGNAAVLAYVPAAPMGPEEPSFGYTYTLRGHPFVEPGYYDTDVYSWVYGVTYERLAVLTGISTGFLFQNVA